MNTVWPLASLISMLCWMPASWLSNSIWKAASAGALRSGVPNAKLAAVWVSTVPPGATEAAGAPEAPGAAGGTRGAEAPGAAGAGVLKASDQQAGYGVAPGAGL